MQALSALLQLTAAFVVLGTCGYAVAVTWRLRGDDAALSAMPIGWGLIAVVGLLGAFTPIRLTLLTVALGFVVAAGVGLATGRRRRLPPGSWAPSGPTLLGLAAAQLVAFAAFAIATRGDLRVAIQTFDTSSHVNTIRHIAQTGIGDPWHAQAFMSGAQVRATAYPTAFVDLGAVLVRLLGADGVVAGNLTAILLAGSLWPSTIAILTRLVAGPRRTVTLAALACSLGTFGMPWAPMMWGVLWTTAAGAAFVPLVVGGFAAVLGLTRRPASRAGALALAAGGVVLVLIGHPRLLVLAAPALLVMLAWRLLAGGTDLRRGHRVGSLVGVTALVLVAVAVISSGVLSRKVAAMPWDFRESVPGTILAHLYGGPAHIKPSLLVAALTLTGVAIVVTRRRALGWLVTAWAVAVVLDALTAGARTGWPVSLTSWWYTDRYRSATMTSVFAVPLAALGATWLTDRLRRRLGTARSRPVAAAAGVVVLASGLVIGTGPLTARYITSADDTAAGLVSPAEITFFDEAARAIAADPGVVLNNPGDGSALFYAYSGEPVAFYHLDQAPATRRARWLRANLRTGDHAVVCNALKQDGVGWVMDLGPTYHNERLAPSPAPGMTIPDDFWATKLVLSKGNARLFQVTC